MKRHLVNLLTILTLGLSLSCGVVAQPRSSAIDTAQRPTVQSLAGFEDQTQEIVGHAERLIEKNDREGAVLDQKWYGFRRFGKYQELFLGADRVLFYGGLEADIRSHIERQYLTLAPLDENQDPGDIRLFAGRLPGEKWDYIVIGQNGREVALKTMIRLIYMAKFADADMKRKHRVRLQAFSRSLRVFMSPVSPRHEYLTFFNKHDIRNPDAVVIGFMSDARALMSELGFVNPETYSDESLRVTWHKNANGKKVLLISINGNRIFASRSAQLIEAIYEIAPDSRPLITFLGSAGAVDAPELVGKIVAPTSVMNGDPFPKVKDQGALVHLIRNRAADLVPIQSTHASVESVVVETTEWAREIKNRRVRTVDQELYYVIDAINSSARGAESQVYAGILVTDNIATDKSATEITLEHA
ncbi:MAG TPA: hypothetical protein VK603_13020, partial [Candidatus Saccharimonadales bacterium]|nr:hypothetical protein [Candidatus Saccharimonadales bacterium]